MNENAYNRQMQMWKDTNASAQMRELKKAGLNPSLMYGGSGAGGSTTTGSNSAGSASGGAAPVMGMDISSIVQAFKAVADLGLTKASTGKVQEETREKRVDANVSEFGEQTSKDEFTVRSQELTKLEMEIQAEMEAKGKLYIEDGREKTGFQKIFENEVKQSNSETDRKINEVLLQGLQGEMLRSNIEYTDEKKNAIWHEVRQKWASAGFSGLGQIIRAVIAKGK
jgi:hypothetical protein